MLNRRAFLAGGAALLQPAPKPNLLFIMADQWRAQTLPGLDPNLHAPNLERLAKQSVRFDRAYCTYPVCGPSRASIMTGRYPHACRMPENDMQLPLDQVCFGDVMRRAGYATGYIGKWHLDGGADPGFVPPGPRRRGFDYWAAFNRGFHFYDSTYFRDDDKPIRPIGFEPDYQTSLAVDFIRAQRSQPYCLFVSWGPPHAPLQPPPRTANMYSPGEFRLRDNVPADDEANVRAMWAGYYGLCSALDDDLGRLLQAASSDTIVVFTSDHGDMLGSHGRIDKNIAYDEAVRVPLYIRDRRLQPGTSDLLVSNIDYMPTLLALCGVQPPATVQGRDLSGLMLTGKGDKPQSVLAEGMMGEPGEWRMIVRGYDKLVTNARGEPLHMFNLAQDPLEMEDLAKQPRHALKIDELKAQLRELRKRSGDGMDASGLKTR